MRPNGSPRTHSARRTRGRALARLSVGLVVGALLLTGCAADQRPRLGMPEPITNQGPRILLLWQASWLTAFIVGGLVWGLIIWCVIFYRRRSADEPLPKQTRYNIPIEALYTVLPIIVIAGLFYYTARDEAEIERVTGTAQHTINVHAFQWSWQFNYLDENVSVTGTPANRPTLVLPQGQSVEFRLTSSDVIHSFWVPAFLYKLDVIPGRENKFEITPEKIGTYAGRCAELCGQDHARMLFTVKIVSAQDYQKYIAGLKSGSAK